MWIDILAIIGLASPFILWGLQMIFPIPQQELGWKIIHWSLIAIFILSVIRILWHCRKKIPFFKSKFNKPKNLFDKVYGDQSVSIWSLDINGNFYLAQKLPGKGRETEAILLLLKGYKKHQTDRVPEDNLMKSLEDSGYVLKNFAMWISSLNEAGYILNAGARRSKSYIITNEGLKKATEVEEELTKLLSLSLCDEKSNPIEIVFDTSNTDGEFWGQSFQPDVEGWPEIIFWEYRVKIKNNSKNKTLRNVRLSIQSSKPLPYPLPEWTFLKNKKETIDINPQCHEMAVVFRWSLFKENRVLTGSEYGPLEVTASADDTKKTVKFFDLDSQKTPMISEKIS